MAEPHAQPRPHRRRVPRWVWFAVVCMALGAMTSVGVAWWIAWNPAGVRSTPSSQGARPTGVSTATGQPLFWRALRFERQFDDLMTFAVGTSDVLPDFAGEWGAPRVKDWDIDDAASRNAMRRHLPLLHTEDAEYVSFAVYRHGFPFYCVAMEHACSADVAKLWKGRRLFVPDTGVAYPDAQTVIQSTPIDPAFTLQPQYHSIVIGERSLPTFPLWPGLLANTAIYGGAWAVLIGATVPPIRWFVRRRRAHRGGCPACGYSREGLKEGAPCPECGRTSIPAAR